nr:CoA pyrophosphatase [Arthrobacter sp. 260]
MRAAAVLVVLTDTPHGPAALITERAPDLTHYPGQLVFPGGAADAGDQNAVATALREACEETGLDSGSVHILGRLPAIALPESGFLLTPVLAWSAKPLFTGTLNMAEVTRLITLPLSPGEGIKQWTAEPASETGISANDRAAAPGAISQTILELLRGMLLGTGETRISED